MKLIISQTSLAGGEINEEEKQWQAKKARMKKKYRNMSMILVGLIGAVSIAFLLSCNKCKSAPVIRKLSD